MGKKKRIHWAECQHFPHFFEPKYHELLQGFPLKGKWYPDFFGNDSPVTLEVGCGKAEYTVHQARKFPNRNFAGVDIKGARMWKGASIAMQEGLKNTAFIRTHIQNLPMVFAPGEIEEIWIPFPDPQPSKPAERKRLTSPQLIDIYRKILRPEHLIHLKTDNPAFYEYTLEIIARENHHLIFATNDLYASGFQGIVTEVTTFYEAQWLAQGAKIHYVQFRINGVR
ncbi:MAG: tRNA (guanosine(46)-N7)-methyltransferase TrmB [Bacteroidales bacterium]